MFSENCLMSPGEAKSGVSLPLTTLAQCKWEGQGRSRAAWGPLTVDEAQALGA